MRKIFILFFFSFSLISNAQDSLKVSKSNLSVIALDNLKVVYRGIQNPITVVLPKNVKSYSVSGLGVFEGKTEGKYLVSPGAGNELVITVQMVFDDNDIVIEEHKYQIKTLPSPLLTLNGEFNTQSYLEFSKEELKEAKVGMKIVDFLIDNFSLEVLEFSLKVPKYKTLKVTGNAFNEEAYNLILKANKNDIILICQVRLDNSYSYCFKSGPLAIKIID